MNTIAIVYFSAKGSTERLAKAIAEGVSSIGEHPKLLKVIGSDIINGRYVNEDILKSIDEADAILWGSPTFMGGAAAEFKSLADASSSRWFEQRWKNKVAAGFTIGNVADGDHAQTLRYFNTFSMQHGMIWLGMDIPAGSHPNDINRFGAHMGISAQTVDGTIDEGDLASAKYLGARVANHSGLFKSIRNNVI